MADEKTAPPGPALSATSDTPDFQLEPPPLSATGWQQDEPAPETPAEEPAPTEPETPAEPVEPAEPAEPTEPKPEGEEQPAEQTAKKRPDQGVGKTLNALEAQIDELKGQISKLTDGTAAERARADKLQGQLNEALLQRDAKKDGEEPAEPKKAENLDPRPVRPKRADFENPDDFENARDQYADDLSAWTLREAERVRITREDQQRIEADRKAEEAKTVNQTISAHNTRVEQAKTKYADYSAVAEAADLPISIVTAQAIMTSDIGPDIAYHLGKNPEEAKRIADMVIPGAVFPDKLPNGQPSPFAGMPVPDERAQLLAIGEITAKLRGAAEPKPEPKKISKAPEPVRPVAQRGTGNQKTADEMSADEYYEQHASTQAIKRAREAMRGVTTH